MNKIMGDYLRSEIKEPQTKLGRRYLAVVISAIIISVFFLFLQQEYPKFASAGSLNEFAIELFLLIIFSFDFIIRLLAIHKKPIDLIFISVDFLAIIPSLITVLCYLGFMQQSDLQFLALLRLLRLARIIKLLRMQSAIIDVFGASVLTLVFSVMVFHLALRVFLLEVSILFDSNIFEFLDQESLMIAVPAVGSVFGIALAISFGIAQRKQIEISELHRLAMDALDAMEADVRRLKPDYAWEASEIWRSDVVKFLNEEISYVKMKSNTIVMLGDLRENILSRPSLDVPFHNNLVLRISQFLTKTQIEFHPVFYVWLNRIAQFYFLLVMFAAPSFTGFLVQMLIIFVFQGLVVIIDDMDHAVDTKVTLLNSKILKV
jgi:hypothetical protein